MEQSDELIVYSVACSSPGSPKGPLQRHRQSRNMTEVAAARVHGIYLIYPLGFSAQLVLPIDGQCIITASTI